MWQVFLIVNYSAGPSDYSHEQRVGPNLFSLSHKTFYYGYSTAPASKIRPTFSIDFILAPFSQWSWTQTAEYSGLRNACFMILAILPQSVLQFLEQRWWSSGEGDLLRSLTPGGLIRAWASDDLISSFATIHSPSPRGVFNLSVCSLDH